MANWNIYYGPTPGDVPPTGPTGITSRAILTDRDITAWCFSNKQGTPWEAPRTGVQIITSDQDQQIGWELISQGDHYYFEESAHGWYVAEGHTLWDVLVRCPNPLILFGRYLSDADFMSIAKIALKELPEPKTAWRRGIPDWLRGI